MLHSYALSLVSPPLLCMLQALMQRLVFFVLVLFVVAASMNASGSDVSGLFPRKPINCVEPNVDAGGITCLGAVGLRNLGNTCFLNSALQCLAQTPQMHELFLGSGFETSTGILSKAYRELLQLMWGPGLKTVSPHNFKSIIDQCYPQFSDGEQHDSQELLLFLLNGLDEDLNETDAEVAEDTTFLIGTSPIQRIFRGWFRNTVKCLTCEAKSVTYAPSMTFCVPIPISEMQAEGTVSLTECIRVSVRGLAFEAL